MLKRSLTITLAALLLAPGLPARAAQTAPLAGMWHGVTPVKGMTPILIDLVLSADGRFGERTQYNGGKSMIFGKYQVVSRNNLRFSATEWNPKQECTAVRCEVVPKPPDIHYEVEALTPARLILKEKKFGNFIIFSRVNPPPVVKKAAAKKTS